MSGIVKRISLSGRLRGSAVIREENGISTVTLSVRGMGQGMSLYTVGTKGTIRVPADKRELSVPQDGICAAVLTENGRLLTGGFTGECAMNRTRLLDEIRIRAASESASGIKKVRKKPEKANEETIREVKRTVPRSEVTGSILERAERLFSVLDALNASAASGFPSKEKESPEPVPAEEMKGEPGLIPVPNPFPRTFPNSVWKRRDGDHRLFGEQKVSGSLRRFIAVPIDPRTKAPRGAKLVIARDGERWMVSPM